ncbi:hypothetical protein BpHYR1_037619 [Brachionus plicatilis]|uniref:Uncharacterized protein n=1 Tax=Brachionus plicatilis TaxID=10195 RepID=A0A3M7S171_BRAPC|nr:hypothetical protein BpHYR1_037619 [Brachionus plicatilis]
MTQVPRGVPPVGKPSTKYLSAEGANCKILRLIYRAAHLLTPSVLNREKLNINLQYIGKTLK